MGRVWKPQSTPRGQGMEAEGGGFHPPDVGDTNRDLMRDEASDTSSELGEHLSTEVC